MGSRTHVWYVSYGSNMAEDRLACYVVGGRPAGGSRHNPGARDRSLPTRSIPVDLPGSIYFAGESRQWGGGMAFYDHAAPGWTAARGYLVTTEQFADIAAQEMYRIPEDGDPLVEVVAGPIEGGRHIAGPGRYETLVQVGEHDGSPLLTFTSPEGIDHVEHNPPSASYLAMLEAGLRESRGWDDEEISEYFDAIVPGSQPGWRVTSPSAAG